MNEEKPRIVLCFWCKRRIASDELHSGRHDHVDLEEHVAYDLAMNDGKD